MVPLELKDLNDVELFKSEIKKWEPRQCECKLCVPYEHSIGSVNISSVTVNFTITSVSF